MAETGSTEGRDALFRSLLESAPDTIVIADEHGRIVIANTQAHRMFGYAAGELIGETVEALLPLALRARHLGHRTAYQHHPVTRPMGLGLDLVGRRKDGSEFPVEISLSPLRTAEGLLVISVVRDITDRKRSEAHIRRLQAEQQRHALEQAARRSERLAALGTLAAGLAHELNNPIGIISSRIELMLLESEGLPREMTDDLRVLHRHAQRVAKIAQNLLSFARQSSGERRPVELPAIVEETLLLVGSQLASAGIRVTTKIEPAPPIFGDSGALQQVVLNLLTNARDAVESGGEIRICITAPADRPGAVQLMVEDTGRGIRPEHLAKIFDPFFTSKPTGTGLGLSVTDGIVREHEGTIDVQSTVGEGTRFVLTFPAAPSSA
ncbi:MAG: PAS domain S-box protein [Candidatus Rokubacteria bacterium]|nr:PAS domain S-box protein [Candidatus Rokubacteria bacterium]